MFLMYTSPLMLCSAVCLVLLFYRIHINSEKTKKMVIWLSSSSFAVYLIHVQPVFFKFIFTGSFGWIAKQKWALIPGLVVLCGICIYIVCVSFDQLRQRLFRITGIQNIVNLRERRLLKHGICNGKKQQIVVSPIDILISFVHCFFHCESVRRNCYHTFS